MMKHIEVVGIDALAHLISALTEKQNMYVIKVYTDDFQSFQTDDKRAFMVELENYDDYFEYKENYDNDDDE